MPILRATRAEAWFFGWTNEITRERLNIETQELFPDLPDDLDVLASVPSPVKEPDRHIRLVAEHEIP